MEQLIITIILGVIQGLTEWLPISSAGHLRLATYFLGLEAPILFDVTLHTGTLFVIFLFFRSDIQKIFQAFRKLEFTTEDGELIPLIIIGTIPTVLIGLVFGNIVNIVFKNLIPIAIAFIICGIILYSSKCENKKEKNQKISNISALAIGAVQGIAIIPGISRSGITIITALFFGIKGEKAFKFSFLVSIPAVIGALGFTAYTQFDELAKVGLGCLDVLVGITVAIATGYFALKLLWKTLINKKLYLFAFYCWLVGATLIMLSLYGF